MSADSSKKSGDSITREELTGLLDKYDIGKKPLSKLLGWGETTILLYLKDGEELPDNEYTRRLKRLYAYPVEYLELLNSGEDRISSVAKRRSISAVKGLFPRTPIFEAAEYVEGYHDTKIVGNDGEKMSLLRLETILFWSQIVSLCLFDKPLFDDDYVPSRTGLPYRSVQDRVLGYHCLIPEGLYEEKIEDITRFDEGQLEVLRFMTDLFDWFGTSALSALAEAEHYRLCGPRGARKRRSASKDMLKKCYGEVFKQSKVKKLKDVELYMQKRISYVRAHKE